MYKKLLSTIFLTAILTVINLIPTFATSLDYKIAELNNVKCLINGKTVYINAYNIEGNNYFKIRDICKELDYFVNWNDIVKTIWIRTNKPYIYEEEKEKNLIESVHVAIKKQWIYVNDATDEINTCDIGGYNYFMLRDLQKITEMSMLFNVSDKYFKVDWNEENSSIVINSLTANNKNDTQTPNNNQSLPTTITENNNNNNKNEEKTYTNEEFQNEVLKLVNIEREKVGVAPLEADPLLMEIAMLKAKEMVELNYFSHESPNFGNPTEFAKHYGYDNGVGENIHAGFDSENPQDIVNSWMASEGHRENIINENYNYMGFGNCINSSKQKLNYKGTVHFFSMYSVQMFSRNN